MTWLKSIWTIIWKSGAFLLLWALLYAPFVALFAPWIEHAAEDSPLLLRFYFDATGALAILLAAWGMARFIDRRPFSTLGFATDHLGRDILLGTIIGFLWLVLSLTILGTFGWANPQPAGSINGIALGVAGVAMVLNTVTQEVLARSYIFQTIEAQTNPTWAVLISTLIFTLYHAAGFNGAWLPAINVFGAGILFGIAYYLAGNLWLPIAIHFTWNFLLGPVSGLTVSGQDLANAWQLFTVQGPALFTGGEFGVEGGLIVTVITVTSIVVLWLWYPRQVKPASVEMEAVSTA